MRCTTRQYQTYSRCLARNRATASAACLPVRHESDIQLEQDNGHGQGRAELSWNRLCAVKLRRILDQTDADRPVAGTDGNHRQADEVAA